MPDGVVPLVLDMSGLLPEQQLADLVSLSWVLSRPSAWPARTGSASLLELEECACRQEQNRGGRCDANGGNKRD